jgi:hypothetical protein
LDNITPDSELDATPSLGTEQQIAAPLCTKVRTLVLSVQMHDRRAISPIPSCHAFYLLSISVILRDQSAATAAEGPAVALASVFSFAFALYKYLSSSCNSRFAGDLPLSPSLTFARHWFHFRLS